MIVHTLINIPTLKLINKIEQLSTGQHFNYKMVKFFPELTSKILQ